MLFDTTNSKMNFITTKTYKIGYVVFSLTLLVLKLTLNFFFIVYRARIHLKLNYRKHGVHDVVLYICYAKQNAFKCLKNRRKKIIKCN